MENTLVLRNALNVRLQKEEFASGFCFYEETSECFRELVSFVKYIHKNTLTIETQVNHMKRKTILSATMLAADSKNNQVTNFYFQ